MSLLIAELQLVDNGIEFEKAFKNKYSRLMYLLMLQSTDRYAHLVDPGDIKRMLDKHKADD